MEPTRTDEPKRLSRRGFLGRVGVGAVAVGTAGAFGADPGAAAPRAAAAHARAGITQHFGRLFERMPSFAVPGKRGLEAALVDIGSPGGIMDAGDALERGPVDLITDPSLSAHNRDNPTHTAGTTFFGQFMDHDMTFDTGSPLGKPTAPEQSPNGRTPSFDLDSVYGAGPVGSPQLYDPADRAKLKVESAGLFEDVPRMADGTAIVGDPRNDEHVVIAGLQAAFLRFHNNAVDRLRAGGTIDEAETYSQARRLTTWHYQWLILHEFLPLFIGQARVADLLARGRQFYRPREAFMPVEFQGASYRFGHSMVRPSYRANLAGDKGKPFFGLIFDPAGQGQEDPVDLRGGARAPRRFIGWQTFFDFGSTFTDGPGDRTPAIRPNKQIDTHISTPLFRLPLATIADGSPPISLPQRNLLRQVTWSLPAGQRIAQTIGAEMLHLQELAGYGVALENQTPLWYYVLAEAELLASGLHLGPVGGRIVGEVFNGLLELDPRSYVSRNPQWKPTLPAAVPGSFQMTDLLRFARVDPAGRGQ
jgi:hypothetical protein